MLNTKKIKKIFGIDTLYFFYQTKPEYENLFLEMVDQLNFQENRYKAEKQNYKNTDMFFKLNHSTLIFNGKAEGGFHWFSDSKGFFRIGFKNPNKNRGLHDIYVQLQSIGVYTLGIQELLNYLDDLLKDYVSDYKYVSRVDYNCFVQYDFSFIDKTMFASKKQKYSSYGEIGTSKSVQTLYVGKKPFMLRIYDKKTELIKSKKSSKVKKELMFEHFRNNDFELDKPIFNIEFEMHRSYLKKSKILSVQDAIKNANNLFKESMDSIRLIDINTLSDSALDTNNKNRAETLDIWVEIKNEYNYKYSSQNPLPLEKIKRALNTYDDKKFEIEYKGLIRKSLMNNLYLDITYITTLFEDVMIKHYGDYEDKKRLDKNRIELEFEIEPGKFERYIQRQNGDVLKGIVYSNVEKLDNQDLEAYYSLLKRVKHLSNKNAHLFKIAENQMVKRKLITVITFNEPSKEFEQPGQLEEARETKII